MLKPLWPGMGEAWGEGGSSAGFYLANPTFPIPSHCGVINLQVKKCPSAPIVMTSTLNRVKPLHKYTFEYDVCMRCVFTFSLYMISIHSSI